MPVPVCLVLLSAADFCRRFRLGEDREEDGSENRDDGDYDQQFDEGESLQTILWCLTVLH